MPNPALNQTAINGAFSAFWHLAIFRISRWALSGNPPLVSSALGTSIMETFEFAHQKFCASGWEAKLKKFIELLDCTDNIIWHRKRKHKKINEELATLGYYVKYRYGEDESITFKLNKTEGKADGWIYKHGAQIESVQIVIAYYEQEEAKLDRRTMNGEDIVVAGWVGDRIELLKDRVEKRVAKKSNMSYQNIDTLLIGVRDWFVRSINNEYQEQKVNVVKYIESCMLNSNFKQFTLVDADFAGKGELLIVPNKANAADAKRRAAD